MNATATRTRRAVTTANGLPLVNAATGRRWNVDEMSEAEHDYHGFVDCCDCGSANLDGGRFYVRTGDSFGYLVDDRFGPAGDAAKFCLACGVRREEAGQVLVLALTYAQQDDQMAAEFENRGIN